MGSGVGPLAMITRSSDQTAGGWLCLKRGESLRRSWRCARDGRDQADRAIRTGQLHTLLCVHLRPINVVVYHGSRARPGLEGGFPLRCLQRLSRPHMATRRCRWRDNRYTRGASIPVLSY